MTPSQVLKDALATIPDDIMQTAEEAYLAAIHDHQGGKPDYLKHVAWAIMGEQPMAWQPFVTPDHPFAESPRKAAEAVSERTAFQVEATIASAVAGVSGQPEMIPALTVQHDGVNVDGPERAGVTAGETAPLIQTKHIGGSF